MNSFEATIEKLAFGGNGVCRVDGKVCFVSYSAPGDQVRLAVISEKRSFRIARIVELLEPSEQRTTPPCPLFGTCGGCSWQHLAYEAQLQAKQQILAETMWRGARVTAEHISFTVPSPQQYGYRSRVQFKIHSSGKKLQIGFFRTASHTVEDIGAGCPIAKPELNEVIARFRPLLANFPDTRSISAIHLDCADQGVIAVVNFAGRDSAALVTYLKKNRELLLPLSGLFLQTEKNKPLSKLFGDNELSYGMPPADADSRPTLLSYQAGGFAQVNRDQNQAMLAIIRRLAAFSGSENILDLYCGNGNFSLPIASQVATVTGIEEHPGSIASAKSNSLKNRISNTTFICEDAAAGARRLADGGRCFDTVILDPPRAGAAECVPEICRLNPNRIIYVSCDPSTAARDCGLLAEHGYRIVECVPVDMFPQTYHIESVTLLHKI